MRGNDSQRIVDLMSRPRGKLTQGLHFACMSQSFIDLFLFGNVLSNPSDTINLTLLIDNRKTTISNPANLPIGPDNPVFFFKKPFFMYVCTRPFRDLSHSKKGLPYLFAFIGMNGLKPEFGILI